MTSRARALDVAAIDLERMADIGMTPARVAHHVRERPNRWLWEVEDRQPALSRRAGVGTG